MLGKEQVETELNLRRVTTQYIITLVFHVIFILGLALNINCLLRRRILIVIDLIILSTKLTIN